jgi:hypothetical protein
MQGSFKISQQLRRGQWLASTLYIMPRLRRMHIYLGLLAVWGIVTGFSAVRSLSDPNSRQALIFLFLPILIIYVTLLLVFISITLYNHWNHPAFSRKIVYEFTHWGVGWHFSQGEFEMSWQNVLASKETKSYFVFHTGNDFHVFHKKSLSSIDKEIFRNILREKTAFKGRKRKRGEIRSR